MTAPPSKSSISGSPSRATGNAGFGQLWDWLTELLFNGTATAAEKAAARASLQAARGMQPITASVAASALTLTLNPTNLEFRSATIGSGTVNMRTVAAAISVVISSGSTLGTVSGAASRIALLAIDNAGAVELAAVNADGGFHFDESQLISTTAEGGAGAADSASVVYSTTARSNVAFRFVGYVESTQATAGTWATAPSKIQGGGGLVHSPVVSMVRVGTANGYGSTNTVIRRFTTVLDNVGSDITYADSATLGATFTINRPGVYSCSFNDSFNASSNVGLSLNSNQLTTGITSIAAANRIGLATGPSSNQSGSLSVTRFFAAGDVIRAHTEGNAVGATNVSMLTITRVS